MLRACTPRNIEPNQVTQLKEVGGLAIIPYKAGGKSSLPRFVLVVSQRQ